MSERKSLNADTTSNTYRVLMLGCGQMGGALLSRWHQVSGYQFTVVSPSGQRAVPSGVRMIRSASELPEGEPFDIIIVAVKPQKIAEVLPDYANLLAGEGFIISIAAGASCVSLATLVASASPPAGQAHDGPAQGGVPVVRIMPNLPVSEGKGVSGLFPNEHARDVHKDSVDRLMHSTGTVRWVGSEDELDRITAIAGSGSGYAFEIANAWVKASQGLGFSEQESRDIVLKTLEGAISMALQSDTSLQDLRERVTSKNGTTHAGLQKLNGDSQLSRLFDDTVNAAYNRAVELR